MSSWYTVAHPKRCSETSIGRNVLLRSAVAVQSASTNVAPVSRTNLRAAAPRKVPSNRACDWLTRPVQLGWDHRQSPTSVRRPVFSGTAAPR